jgi:plasmid stabilization system protein ParE
VSKQIRLEPEAEQELRQAARWYDQRQPGLGTELLAVVAATFSALVEHPTLGAPVPGVRADLPIRRVLLRRFPYAIVFLEMGGTVRVLAIAHRRRRPGYWMKRVRK